MPILREHKLLAWIDDGLRHHLALRALATVLAPILVLIAVTALLQTRRANDDAIAQSIANMDLYTQTARSVPLDVVSDANVLPVLPLLDQAADLPSAVKAPTQWFPGLSQTDKLGAGAHEVYRRALEHILLPRLIVRLENQVRSNLNQPHSFTRRHTST